MHKAVMLICIFHIYGRWMSNIFNSLSLKLQHLTACFYFRAGLQKYNSLRSILLMDEQTWRARYPIAQQLAELQAAAEGGSRTTTAVMLLLLS